MGVERGSSRSPRIEIRPESSLADEPLQAKLTGFRPYHPTTVGYTRVFSGMALDFGGSPEANARASINAWAQILRFLRENLRC